MANISGKFTADAETEEFVATRITFLIGATTGTQNNFGGGTVTFYVSHDGVNWTADSTYTAEGATTTIDYAGGIRAKLALSGATSPDLLYSISYQ